MCGISGYIGLGADKQSKLMLILGLADGIDSRGGHSCGYVSVTDNELKYARKKGVWVSSRLRFIEGAAGDICMMHARYATCGNRDDPNSAHPFAIRRNGRVVLWGAHNGMVPDAFNSAKSHGREVKVDSQEIFELLADNNHIGIQKLAGYGVISWIETDNREKVNIARLSSQSDICVASIIGGGIVWASTWKILSEALTFAELQAENIYELDEIGRVYSLQKDGVFKTKIDGIKVESWSRGSAKKTYNSIVHINTSQSKDHVETKALPPANAAANKGSGAYSPNPSRWNQGQDKDQDDYTNYLD